AGCVWGTEWVRRLSLPGDRPIRADGIHGQIGAALSRIPLSAIPARAIVAWLRRRRYASSRSPSNRLSPRLKNCYKPEMQPTLSSSRAETLISAFAGRRIIVLGDVMLDEFV